MNVAAVSHFVDDAIAMGVVADIPPAECSWITAPSSSAMRIIPSDVPAARTRWSSMASVASNASAAYVARDAGGAVVVGVSVVAS